MSTILDRSPLASYSFTTSQGIHIRVCYQDKLGNIKQTFYDQATGWKTRADPIVGTADLNNGLAITGWSNGTQERVYYIGKDNKIVERCYTAGTSGWYDGALTGKFTAAHYSNLAAMTYEYNGTRCIRVVYQDPDNIIRILYKDGDAAWGYGQTFQAGIQGSSIACSYVEGGTNNRFLYYQLPNTTFIEYVAPTNGGWKLGGFKSQLVYDPGAYIAAASYPNVNHRIFTLNRDNKLCVTEYDASSWGQTKQLTDTIAFSPAAATLVAGSTRIRVYTQIASGQIAEWGTNDGKTYSFMANPLPTN